MRLRMKALCLTLGLAITVGAIAGLMATRPDHTERSTDQSAIGIPSFAPTGSSAKDTGDRPPYTSPPPTTLPAVVPVERHMSDVVITLDDPDSTYNRWLRGEDISEAHILSEERMAELREQALNQPVDEDMQRATRAGGEDAPTPGVGFASIDYTQAGARFPRTPKWRQGPRT